MIVFPQYIEILSTVAWQDIHDTLRCVLFVLGLSPARPLSLLVMGSGLYRGMGSKYEDGWKM